MRSSEKFSFNLLWSLLVVVLQMLMLPATASVVDVSVNPSTIQVGLSPSLGVNCTSSINTTSAMAAIFSLTVSRGNISDLASITSFADHQVNVISSEGITADGVINPGGQSYIHLHWDYPTDSQKGIYQCVARGIDNLGHNVESVNTSVVNVDQIDLLDVVKELRNLRQMETYISQLEERVASLEFNAQYGLTALFHIPPLTYYNRSTNITKKQYYVSLYEYHSYQESIDVCKAHGGTLAEMDVLDEYEAVQEYIQTFPAIRYLVIGGSDQANPGDWVLPSTNQTLPFIDWYHTNETRHGCLALSNDTNWRMYPGCCHDSYLNYYTRYMCEIPL